MEFLVENYSAPMNKINDLHTQLLANIIEIDALTEAIEKNENDLSIDPDELEKLYRREFYLYMDHIGIYDDLIQYLDNEPKTTANEFELARIRRDAQKMLRVTVVEL